MLEAGVLQKNKKIIFIVAAILFLLLLPLSLSINFYQNDDWVYYLNVKWFLDGNFVLHQYVGPTFYVQGLIATLFTKLFSLERLPVLTLLFSSINFYLVSIICLRFLKRSLVASLLLGFLFYISPINIYLLWGFMTEHYFLPFLLTSIYLLLLYEESGKNKYIYLTFVVSFFGLLTRQISLMIPLSMAIYFIIKKNYKQGFASLVSFIVFYLFLNYIFPLTAVMKEEPLRFHHLLNFDYAYSLSYGILLVSVAFLLPLFISLFDVKEIFRSKLHVLLFVLLAIVFYLFLNSLFKPETISWGEFPYFENTVERTGFYPRGVHGTKYQFVGNYDLYRFWDLGAKIILSLSISYVLVFKKLKFNIFIVLSIVYLCLITLTETFYDRYIFMLIPLTIFYISSLKTTITRFDNLLVASSILVMTFLMYQFSMDFILVNKYIWSKSQQIVKSENIEEMYIHGTNAWKLNYRNEARTYKYLFSYDSPEVNSDLANLYSLVEMREINYPLSIFINPKIYLYKLN